MKNEFIGNGKITNHDLAVLLLRVTISALMLTHGLPKLLSLVNGQVEFPAMFGLSAALSLALAVFAEVVCSILILFGVGTRLATIPLMFTMLVAVFYIHSADPLAKKEVAILYLLAYVILFFTGSGKYSIENRKQVPA